MRALNIYAAIVASVLLGLALAVAAEADEQPGATPTPPPKSDIVLMPSCAKIAYSVSIDDKTKTTGVICNTPKLIEL